MCRLGPPYFFSSVIRTTNAGTVLATIAAGAVGPECAVEFQQTGVVVGWSGVPYGDGSVGGQSSLAVRLLVNERDQAFTRNATGFDVTSFATAFGLQAQRVQPLHRKVKAHQIYAVQASNISAAAGPFIPEMDFFFLDEQYAKRSDRYAGFFQSDDPAYDPRPDAFAADKVVNVSSMMRVPGFSAVNAAATGLPVSFKFADDGLVVGLSGAALGSGTPASMGSLGVQIQVNDNAGAITSNGISPDFANFGCLFGLDGSRVAPLLRRVKFNEIWTFTIRNDSVAGVQYLPEIGLWFVNRKLALQYPELAPFVAS